MGLGCGVHRTERKYDPAGLRARTLETNTSAIFSSNSVLNGCDMSDYVGANLRAQWPGHRILHTTFLSLCDFDALALCRLSFKMKRETSSYSVLC
jgi:hypothetical protein